MQLITRRTLASLSVYVLSACAPSDGSDGALLAPTGHVFSDAPARVVNEPPELECRDVATFGRLVAPRLVADCLRCHDGQKPLATASFDLHGLAAGDAAALASACGEALLNADTVEPALSPLLLLVKPDDHGTDHEFRYPSSETFTAFQADLLRWLESEAWQI